MYSLSKPGGGRFTYAYDAAGRLASLVNPQSERATFAYNAAGRNTLRLPGNATRSTLVYDAAGRTRAVRHATSGGANIAAFTYTYDPAGQRTQVVEASGDVTTWAYDNTYQLTRERRSGLDGYDVTYSYDPAGNRVLKIDSAARTTSTYDAANRLLTEDEAAGATTFTYDDAGNRRSKEEPSGDLTTMTWDYENMSTSVELPSNAITTYTYNGDEQRISKEDSTGEADFLFDGLSILAEYDDLGVLDVTYTHQPDRYGALISQNRDGDSSFYHFDALGSTAALTDDAEVITDTYVYYAFGAENATSGTTENPFRWIGEQGYYQESTLGLYNLRARDYDPAAAVFVSEDPLGFDSGDENLYRYVGNSPSNATDPSGLGDRARRGLWDWIDDIRTGINEEIIILNRGVDRIQATGLGIAGEMPEATGDVTKAFASGVPFFLISEELQEDFENVSEKLGQGVGELPKGATELGTLLVTDTVETSIGIVVSAEEQTWQAVFEDLPQICAAVEQCPGALLANIRQDLAKKAINPRFWGKAITAIPGVMALKTFAAKFIKTKTLKTAALATEASAVAKTKPVGRPGNPDHVADVATNNNQATGVLVPKKVKGPLGNTVPDGVGRPGQTVTIRGKPIDPGDGRVLVESERFRANGQMVGHGREQIRKMRAADPDATIVVTDPAKPNAPPVIFPPGHQPPPTGRLPKGSPTDVPFP